MWPAREVVRVYSVLVIVAYPTSPAIRDVGSFLPGSFSEVASHSRPSLQLAREHVNPLVHERRRVIDRSNLHTTASYDTVADRSNWTGLWKVRQGVVSRSGSGGVSNLHQQ